MWHISTKHKIHSCDVCNLTFEGLAYKWHLPLHNLMTHIEEQIEDLDLLNEKKNDNNNLNDLMII